MKRTLLFCLVTLTAAYTHTQPTTPLTVDSTTRALWHFDEEDGSFVRDVAWGVHGTAYGTTIVPGRFGNARYFNGTSDYVNVPSNPAFNFGDTSFSVELWFRTTNTQGILIRRGLAPQPGFLLGMNLGCVAAQVGNRGDSRWPDTLLTIQSDLPYNDNNWHFVKFVRDRTIRKFFLYIDGVQAAASIDDPISFPLSSDRPLTIGRWEYYAYPAYITGTIDEVRISCAVPLHAPVEFDPVPQKLLFGNVLTGGSDSLRVTIRNAGNRDTLRVLSMSPSSPQFTVRFPLPPIPPLGAETTIIAFSPVAAGLDTGAIVFLTNDPVRPTFRLPVSGTGVLLGERPVIDRISSINSSSARLVWFRSSADAASAPDRVTEYSLWRDVPTGQGSVANAPDGQPRLPLSTTLGTLWEFVATIPAMTFDRYTSAVSRRSGVSWEIFIVGAHTRGGEVFVSDPETLRVPTTVGVEQPLAERVPLRVDLLQNFPNPFNPTTTIRYGLSERAHVTLAVYSTLGQHVATIAEGEEESGYHEVRFDASGLSSGLYLCRLTAGNHTSVRKFLLMK